MSECPNVYRSSEIELHKDDIAKFCKEGTTVSTFQVHYISSIAFLFLKIVAFLKKKVVLDLYMTVSLLRIIGKVSVFGIN